MKISIDSDVILMDRLLPHDPRYATNAEFLRRAVARTVCVTIFNLLEICGVLSFHLPPARVGKLLADFHRMEGIAVLYPPATPRHTKDFIRRFISHIGERVLRQMHFGDAATLYVAEANRCTHLVTWNKRHFEGRTKLTVLTPEECLNLGLL